MTYPSGIKFPFAFSTAGGVARSQSARKVGDNLNALILSGLNERVIRKRVGVMGYQRLFRLLGTDGNAAITTFIQEAITEHEPRARVIRVQFSTEDGPKGKLLRVKVEYSLKGSPEINERTIDQAV